MSHPIIRPDELPSLMKRLNLGPQIRSLGWTIEIIEACYRKNRLFLRLHRNSDPPEICALP